MMVKTMKTLEMQYLLMPFLNKKYFYTGWDFRMWPLVVFNWRGGRINGFLLQETVWAKLVRQSQIVQSAISHAALSPFCSKQLYSVSVSMWNDLDTNVNSLGGLFSNAGFWQNTEPTVDTRVTAWPLHYGILVDCLRYIGALLVVYRSTVCSTLCIVIHTFCRNRLKWPWSRSPSSMPSGDSKELSIWVELSNKSYQVMVEPYQRSVGKVSADCLWFVNQESVDTSPPRGNHVVWHISGVPVNIWHNDRQSISWHIHQHLVTMLNDSVSQYSAHRCLKHTRFTPGRKILISMIYVPVHLKIKL